jgi:molybdate transport system regulatory protein
LARQRTYSRASQARPALRARAWIEIDRLAAFTEAGADLLEQIEFCGSLSEAARRLRFSYRRAWMLIDAMNRRWPSPLVQTAIGGKRGGGTRLTELGRNVLATYRDLQVQLEHLLDRSTPGFSILVK